LVVAAVSAALVSFVLLVAMGLLLVAVVVVLLQRGSGRAGQGKARI
jgi:hypothetical protein